MAAQSVRMLADLVATLLPLRATQLKLRSVAASGEDADSWKSLLASIDAGGDSRG